jgi:uncharacterized protein
MQNLPSEALPIVSPAHREQLFTIVRSVPWLMACLREARQLDLTDWFIAAGAIRNAVWDHLHGRDCSARPADIDLVHFSRTLPRAADARLQTQLAASTPGQMWDVTNQAHVHTWYGAGQANAPQLSPLCSTLHGISMWPETATAVGVRLEADDSLTLAAPLGLEDLFAQRLRWNPRLVSREIFLRRVSEKHFLARWPGLTLMA